MEKMDDEQRMRCLHFWPMALMLSFAALETKLGRLWAPQLVLMLDRGTARTWAASLCLAANRATDPYPLRLY